MTMTIEGVRKICKALPEVTEDVKWGHDLCFSVGGKMFAAMDLNPPHALGFKCTPEGVERHAPAGDQRRIDRQKRVQCECTRCDRCEY